MTKQITANHIEMMKKGRMEKIKKTHGLIWDLGKGIEIHADSHQYILKMPSEPDQYYHFNSLDMIVEDLFFKRAISSMIQNEQKNGEGVLAAFAKAQKWIEEIVVPQVCLKQPKL